MITGLTRRWLTSMAAMIIIAAMAVGLSLTMYTADLPDAALQTVVQLRGYRLVLSALTGASLAVAGVMMQGLFRNPLADPGLIGAGAAATLGGSLALLFWPTLVGVFGAWLVPEMIIPLACLLGASAALSLLLFVLRRHADMVTVLLFGLILGLFLGGLGSLLRHLIQEDWQLSRAMMAFSQGSISDKGLRHVVLALPLCLASIIAAWRWAPQLDLLQTGEDEARSLGLNVGQAQRWLLLWSAVPVATAVAVAGNINFVGLMVPHMLRRIIGPQHRQLIPACALGGATFVLCCDTLGHALGPSRIIPLGVVTGLIGAPLFIWLLISQRHQQHRGMV